MQVVPPQTESAARHRPFVERPAGVLLLLAAAVVLFTLLSLRPLSRSESRYVEAGYEMATGGDWIVPHLAYVPYFEKPILAYWAEAASWLAFGGGAVAARLQAIVSCIVMLACTCALGTSLRGRAFGLGAAALLLSSAYFMTMGSVVTTDPLFAACLAIAWHAFRRHDLDPAGPWIWAFWTSLGVAVLTKGPLALVFAGVSIGPYLWLSGRFRDVLATRPVRGVAVVVAVNLPWSLLVWRRDPRFLEFFYVRENLQAFFDGRINHPGPPWYYVPLLVAAFLPFCAIVAVAFASEIRAALAAVMRRQRAVLAAASTEGGRLYVVCLLVGPLLFLSVSSSKLLTYLLPLMPAAALLAAGWIADRLERPAGVLRWGVLAQAVLVAAALPVAIPLVLRHPEAAEHLLENVPVLCVSIATLLLALAAGGIVMARRRVVLGMAVSGALTAAGLLLSMPAVGEITMDLDAGLLMPRVVALRAPGERVILAGQCAQDFAVVLALKERVHLWGAARELGMGHFAEVTPPDAPIPRDPYDVGGPRAPLPQNPWILDDTRMFSAWRGPERAWLIGRRSDLDRLHAAGLTAYLVGESDSRVVLVNRPLPGQ